jgi:hypothetical protein
MQWKAGSKVKSLPVASLNSIDSQQMALVADSFAQRRTQPAGIHNRFIELFFDFAPLPSLDVKFSRSVTAFTADGIAVKDGGIITIFGILYTLGLVTVAN